MAKKNKFNEVWDLLSEENKEITKGKKVKNVPFSKKKKTVMTQALLNDVDYEVDIIKTKDGAFETETVKPIEEFRKQFIGKVLIDNGIDKAQAETAVKEYQYSQKQCEAFYPVQMEDAEQFMRAGYALKFMDKPDFSAAIKMSEVPDRVITGKVPNTDKVTKTHEKEHLILTKKSGTPKCCKEKLE